MRRVSILFLVFEFFVCWFLYTMIAFRSNLNKLRKNKSYCNNSPFIYWSSYSYWPSIFLVQVFQATLDFTFFFFGTSFRLFCWILKASIRLKAQLYYIFLILFLHNFCIRCYLYPFPLQSHQCHLSFSSTKSSMSSLFVSSFHTKSLMLLNTEDILFPYKVINVIEYWGVWAKRRDCLFKWIYLQSFVSMSTLSIYMKLHHYSSTTNCNNE